MWSRDAVTVESVLAVIVVAVPVLFIFGFAVVDIVRRRMAIGRKAAWIAAIVLIPGIAVLAYFAMRPVKPPTEADDEGTGVADAIDDLYGRRQLGELDEAAYLRAKQQLFRV